MPILLFFMLLILCSLCDASEIYSLFQEIKLKKGIQHIQTEHRVLQQTEVNDWQPLRVLFQPMDSYNATEMVQVNKLTDIAKQFLATTYLVKRPKKNLVFQDYDNSSCPGGANISSALQSQQYDADLVIFIQLQVMEDAEILAYSQACISDPESQRPIFSILTFGQIVSNTTDPGNIQFEANLQVTIHELTHSLAFNNDLFNYFFDSNTGLSYANGSYVDQNNVLFLSTPRILNYTRHYFGCSSAQGLAMEDQGGDGTYGSHWEKRLLNNEIMSGSMSYGDVVFSVFTLMLLQDSGWYRIGNINPDPMSFGHLKGCDFLNIGCTAGNYPEFCDVTDQTSSCSFTFTGIGVCQIDNLANNCSMIEIYQGLDCRDPLDMNADPDFVQQFNDNQMDFQYNSKCFNGSLSTSNQDTYAQSCHIFVCSNTTNNTLSLKVGSEQYQCDSNNQMLTNSSQTGQIQCPASMNQFCYDYAECPYQCNENGFCVAKICICKRGYTGQGCESQCSFYNYENTCVQSCPKQTFNDTLTMTCMGCPFGCNNCTSIGFCTLCSNGYYLLNNFCERDFSITLPEDIRQDTGQSNPDQPFQSTIISNITTSNTTTSNTTTSNNSNSSAQINSTQNISTLNNSTQQNSTQANSTSNQNNSNSSSPNKPIQNQSSPSSTNSNTSTTNQSTQSTPDVIIKDNNSSISSSTNSSSSTVSSEYKPVVMNDQSNSNIKANSSNQILNTSTSEDSFLQEKQNQSQKNSSKSTQNFTNLKMYYQSGMLNDILNLLKFIIVITIIE